MELLELALKLLGLENGYALEFCTEVISQSLNVNFNIASLLFLSFDDKLIHSLNNRFKVNNLRSYQHCV